MKRHVCVGLNYLTSCSLTELVGMFNDENGQTIPPEQVVAHATILKAQGFQVLPACDNHDAKGYCLGHETISE